MNLVYQSKMHLFVCESDTAEKFYQFSSLLYAISLQRRYEKAKSTACCTALHVLHLMFAQVYSKFVYHFSQQHQKLSDGIIVATLKP